MISVLRRSARRRPLRLVTAVWIATVTVAAVVVPRAAAAVVIQPGQTAPIEGVASGRCLETPGATTGNGTAVIVSSEATENAVQANVIAAGYR